MKTEHKLALTLKSMMSEKPLDEISVISLTKKCGVNRQTFYYHFQDIHDLLAQVFLDEKIDGIDKVRSFDELVEVIFKYYQSNSKFLDAALDSAGLDLCKEFIYNVVYNVVLRFLNKNEKSNAVTITEKKNIARFYSSGFTYSTIYYFANSQKKSLSGYKSYLSFINGKEVILAMDNIIARKGK